MLIDIIAAEQTDFIKIASVIDAIQKEQDKGVGFRYRLIYTGHFNDANINPLFFEQLNISRPNLNLETGTDISDIEQTATVMVRYEKVLSIGKPQFIIITGDSSASMACAITAKKTHNIPIGHIESGVRNNSVFSPHEINSVVADSITDYYFTPSHSANENLRRMGVTDERIFFVGNTRVDTLLKIRESYQQPPFWEKLKLKKHNYFLMCLHRPENMKPLALKELLSSLLRSFKNHIIILPMQRSNTKMIAATGLRATEIVATSILEYRHFIFLLDNAKAVITDYNGIQEEATVLHIPCITVGINKERPETFSTGTNMLISKLSDLNLAFELIVNGKWKKGNIPYMWDGRSAARIIALLKNLK